jgi:hypothetical protein
MMISWFIKARKILKNPSIKDYVCYFYIYIFKKNGFIVLKNIIKIT